MADQPVKRSRFDQAEPQPVQRSKFDRRSRSPAPRDSSDARRSRSPIRSAQSADDEARASLAAQKAAEAASRINAQLSQRKSTQPGDSTPTAPAPSTAKATGSPTDSNQLREVEVYQQDGDFIKDIEINDLRNRYTLTKGSTQKMIKEATGADVTTRGSYFPDKSLASVTNPPLYLHITSTSRDGLDNAVKMIDELIQKDLPNLVDERRFRRRDPPEPRELDSMGRRKWPEERIPLDLEPIPGFNLRAQVVGQQGANVKHIQQETRCRVQIKGRGSGFMESDTGHESDEQMYLHVTGPIAAELARAKELCESLLAAVRENYEAFKERGPPPPRGGHGGNGGYEDRGHHHRGGDRQNSGSYGGSGGGYNSNYANAGYNAVGGAQSPQVANPDADAAAEQQRQYQAWAMYYAQNPQADPYLAYGGFAAYMTQYQQAAQQQQQQQPSYSQNGTPNYYGMGQAQSPVGMGVPPPPPPDDDAPPPPPPPGTSNGSNGFNAVPPPPGL